MSTHGLSPGTVPAPGPMRSRATAALARLDAPLVLGAALALMLLYAAFAHGAAGSPAEPRLQVAVAAVAAVAGAAVVSGRLRLRAPRAAWAGIALLVAFTAWSAATLAWSVSPDGTWTEVNRYTTYAIALLLAVVLGASARRPLELAQRGFLGVALLVALYALGQKLLPWLHVPGLIDLDQTAATPRLQQPFGYWNALALFLVMAVPLALALCVDRTRSARERIAGAVALEVMYLVIGFTYSRGGIVALVVGIAAALAVGQPRLRALLWLALPAVAAAVPLLLGLLNPSLNSANISLGARSVAGVILLALVLASVAGLVRLARRVLALEATVEVTPVRARAITRGLIGLVAGVVLLGIVAVSLSHRGLTGEISHLVHSFTSGKGLNDTNPTNLVSADSGNRWVWWKEAAGAFGARPVGGWGAGSFPVVHLLYRTNSLGTKQPHSVPLQYLAETGIVGAVLAIGAFLALLACGLRAVRSLAAGRERLIAAGLLGAAVAYGVHSCFDWDSDIPGVTLPALAFLGLLAGSAARSARTRRSTAGELPAAPAAGGVPGLRGPARMAAAALLTIVLCAFAGSAVIPSIAASDAASASVAAAGGSPGAVNHAEQQAVLASRLDPLSDAGLRVQASIALGRSRPASARADLVAALRRDPSDPQAWASLGLADLLLDDPLGTVHATQRALDLDPKGAENLLFAGGAVESATFELAPPQDSPTAVQTPQQAQFGASAGSVTPATGAGAP